MSGSNGNVLNPADNGAILNSGNGGDAGGLVPAPVLSRAVTFVLSGVPPTQPAQYANAVAFTSPIQGPVNAGDPVQIIGDLFVDVEAATLEAGATVELRDPLGRQTVAPGQWTIGATTAAPNPNDAQLTRLSFPVTGSTYGPVGAEVAAAVYVVNPSGGAAFAGWLVSVLRPQA